jgi:hypothetical protein
MSKPVRYRAVMPALALDHEQYVMPARSCSENVESLQNNVGTECGGIGSSTHLFRGVCVKDSTGGQLAENPSICSPVSILTGYS